MDNEDANAALAESANWRKASYSKENACVEVGSVPGMIGVRDTKLGAASPILTFDPAEWVAFVRGVKNGEFDEL
ncbi:DUF397 domain-containing protein [Amycolatopsis japonica]|uniref:DUF397 domain-containing protein n=1 Tax=Amycolatopsis japonica TaxID=208439 RepID=UPI003671DFA3